MPYLVGLPSYQNLAEALQLLLARCQEAIKAASQTPEPSQDEPSKRVVSVEAWRPLEPAHVEKARLARRSGRYARYQQAVQWRDQGMKTPAIARQLGMGERPVREGLKQGPFPAAKEAKLL